MKHLTSRLIKKLKFEGFAKTSLLVAGVIIGLSLLAQATQAQDARRDAPPSTARESDTYSPRELVDSGHRFFGSVSKGLATAIESATSRYGRPNAYILGQEGSGAFVAGLRYGEGKIFTKRQGESRIFWQGPSFGFDFGADGARTMMLIYNTPSPNSVEGRFGGVDGSAYFIAGFGLTAVTRDGITIVPIRSGVGLRLGANVNYLKFSRTSTWNPF